MAMELSGRVVLITGASRGLGAAMARAFAAEGARLALAARSEPDLAEVAEGVRKAGVDVATIPADVGDLASLEALVRLWSELLGPLIGLRKSA